MVSIQRHLAVVRGMLEPGEEQRLWIRAERQPQGHAGALLLTDRRLLFSGMGFVAQSQEAWPLPAIRQVTVREGSPAQLSMLVIGLPEAFTGRFEDLRELAARLADTDVEQAAADLVGELERLTALRDAGALSETEFEGAKRRLLE